MVRWKRGAPLGWDEDQPDTTGSRISRWVQQEIGNTCGNLYWGLLEKLPRYSIPELRLPAGKGQRLPDIGCNWGRWTIAASRAGYASVGIDPSLPALLAAKRVAHQLDRSPGRYRLMPRASEALRKLSATFPALRRVADSLYVHARPRSYNQALPAVRAPPCAPIYFSSLAKAKSARRRKRGAKRW